MFIIDRNGNIIETYEDHNMIVNTARVAMAILVSESDPRKKITQFGVGTGDESPTPQDTILSNMYKNDIISHEFPSEGVVKFNWQLDYPEANNMAITEFGLLCADDTLFSRKTRELIYKDSDLAIHGEWSIIF